MLGAIPRVARCLSATSARVLLDLPSCTLFAVCDRPGAGWAYSGIYRGQADFGDKGQVIGRDPDQFGGGNFYVGYPGSPGSSPAFTNRIGKYERMAFP